MIAAEPVVGTHLEPAARHHLVITSTRLCLYYAIHSPTRELPITGVCLNGSHERAHPLFVWEP